MKRSRFFALTVALMMSAGSALAQIRDDGKGDCVAMSDGATFCAEVPGMSRGSGLQAAAVNPGVWDFDPEGMVRGKRAADCRAEEARRSQDSSLLRIAIDGALSIARLPWQVSDGLRGMSDRQRSASDRDRSRAGC